MKMGTMEPNSYMFVFLAVAATVAFVAGVVVIAVSIVQARARPLPPSEHQKLTQLIQSNDELMAISADHARELRDIQRGREQDHKAMMQLQLRIVELEIGVRILTAQLRREGLIPEWVPQSATSDSQDDSLNDQVLQQALAALFSMEELTDLADRLNVPDGEINGDTVTRRARTLVHYMKRRNRLDELVALARQLRPKGEI